jgi:hypothetical protein
MIKISNIRTNRREFYFLCSERAAETLVSKKILRVNPKFEKLIISLRTAYARDLVLDKEQTSYPDILDALRLNLLNFLCVEVDDRSIF